MSCAECVSRFLYLACSPCLLNIHVNSTGFSRHENPSNASSFLPSVYPRKTWRTSSIDPQVGLPVMFVEPRNDRCSDILVVITPKSFSIVLTFTCAFNNLRFLCYDAFQRLCTYPNASSTDSLSFISVTSYFS